MVAEHRSFPFSPYINDDCVFQQCLCFFGCYEGVPAHRIMCCKARNTRKTKRGPKNQVDHPFLNFFSTKNPREFRKRFCEFQEMIPVVTSIAAISLALIGAILLDPTPITSNTVNESVVPSWMYRSKTVLSKDEAEQVLKGLKDLKKTGPTTYESDEMELKVQSVKGDGNCFYRAYAHAAFGNPDLYMKFKRDVADNVVLKDGDIIGLGEEDIDVNEKTIDDVIRSLKKEGCWVNGNTMQAVDKYVNDNSSVPCFVILRNQGNVLKVHGGVDQPCKTTVFLFYIPNIHYDYVSVKFKET